MQEKKEHLEAIVRECLEGKRSAQHKLFKLYYSKMFALCYRYAHSKDEAQDVLSEGFMKVFTKLEQLQNVELLEGWIKRIMVHTALDYQRKYKTQTLATLEYEEVSDAQMNSYEVNQALSKISSDELLELIQQLPPVSKAVFNMFIFEDYTHKEIADTLQIKEGTSHWHLNFARNKLKEWILQSEQS